MVNLPQHFKVMMRNGASINSTPIPKDATTMVHRAVSPFKGAVVQYLSMSESGETCSLMCSDTTLTTRQAISIPCNKGLLQSNKYYRPLQIILYFRHTCMRVGAGPFPLQHWQLAQP